MDPNPLVELRDVSRKQGRHVVLAGVQLEVRAGEVLGLVGPNGGGKSTLLLLLAGLLAPSGGRVTVAGVPARALATQRTGSVGLITAEPGLYPLLTGWENLAFFGGLFGLSAREVRERGEALVEALDLGEAMDRRCGGWSSGMRQKLSLVRARLMRPRLLLLDEPTANLDPVSADTLWRTVRDAADEGLAVVLVTHDLVAAEAICDRVAIVEGTIKHVETLDAERHVPVPGRLLPLYRQHVEGS